MRVDAAVGTDGNAFLTLPHPAPTVDLLAGGLFGGNQCQLLHVGRKAGDVRHVAGIAAEVNIALQIKRRPRDGELLFRRQRAQPLRHLSERSLRN